MKCPTCKKDMLHPDVKGEFGVKDTSKLICHTCLYETESIVYWVSQSFNRRGGIHIVSERIEAAEAQRDTARANLGEVRMLLNAAEDETTSDAAARIVDLLATAQTENAALQERIAELASDMSDYKHVNAFERTAPLDWRSDDETPLGQMLDGIGDEVEP